MPMIKDPEGLETLLLNQSASLTGKRVLEIGCGDGRLTWRFAHAAKLVHAIDPNHEELLRARESCPAELQSMVFFTRGSSIHLPFPLDTFDRTILSWSL